jgi:hypothetical protein
VLLLFHKRETLKIDTEWLPSGSTVGVCDSHRLCPLEHTHRRAEAGWQRSTTDHGQQQAIREEDSRSALFGSAVYDVCKSAREFDVETP